GARPFRPGEAAQPAKDSYRGIIAVVLSAGVTGHAPGSGEQDRTNGLRREASRADREVQQSAPAVAQDLRPSQVPNAAAFGARLSRNLEGLLLPGCRHRSASVAADLRQIERHHRRPGGRSAAAFLDLG